MIFYGWIIISLCYASGYPCVMHQDISVMHQDIPVLFIRISLCYAPHPLQVRNISSCIKVAEDFVSPEVRGGVRGGALKLGEESGEGQ